MATSDTVTGSATVQGELWGARAPDWAEVQEPARSELYRGSGSAAPLRRCGTPPLRAAKRWGPPDRRAPTFVSLHDC
jgi:hypothetical protein